MNQGLEHYHTPPPSETRTERLVWRRWHRRKPPEAEEHRRRIDIQAPRKNLGKNENE